MTDMSAIASLIAAKQARSAPKAAPAPAKQKRDELDWETVQPSELGDEANAAYCAFQKARAHFEAIALSVIEPPDGWTLKFSYRRGLGIALARTQREGGGLAALIAAANAASSQK